MAALRVVSAKSQQECPPTLPRDWIKPGLASGRSPDSRFHEVERLPGDHAQWPSSSLTFRSLRSQLRGSGGLAPPSRTPDSLIIQGLKSSVNEDDTRMFCV
jgi:hypothetical protein